MKRFLMMLTVCSALMVCSTDAEAGWRHRYARAYHAPAVVVRARPVVYHRPVVYAAPVVYARPVIYTRPAVYVRPAVYARPYGYRTYYGGPRVSVGIGF